MKVYIGKYKNWVGPYQIAELLRYVGVSEDRCHDIGEVLAKTWLNDICEWIHSKQSRTVKVRIDNYDVWNADHTLALIILPILKKLKTDKHGGPNTDDKDVPKELRTIKQKNKWDTDENWFKRWDWIMDEMIWSFEQVLDEDSTKQFYSGESDIEFVKCEENPECSTLRKTAKDTFKIDMKGLKAHEARIDNGLRLFGKYYRALWD
jgi:hypothetical protein